MNFSSFNLYLFFSFLDFFFSKVVVKSLNCVRLSVKTRLKLLAQCFTYLFSFIVIKPIIMSIIAWSWRLPNLSKLFRFGKRSFSIKKSSLNFIISWSWLYWVTFKKPRLTPNFTLTIKC